jgi:Cd2+/Zn2+-exporting ATPase
MSDALTQSRFLVGGMDCASCASKVETAARRALGVRDVTVSVTAGSMVVTHAGNADLPDLQRKIAALGYTVTPLDVRHAGNAKSRGLGPEGRGEHFGKQSWRRSPKARLAIASGAGLAAAFLIGLVAPALSPWAFPVAMTTGLLPIARRALAAGLAGSLFSIETLMTIAAVGAVAIGAAEEGAVVVFLFLVGEWLEGIAASRARESIRGLIEFLPETAQVEGTIGLETTPVADLVVGSVVVVRPGDRIGADGTILQGESAIDEAPVTGESIPAAKGPGATVFAGTINGDGVLRIRVTAAAADNTLARVVRLVEEAQETKAPTERFIDRFARVYTPCVVAAAILAASAPPLLAGASWGVWAYHGLALLLIGCPCALVISTPAAIAAALSAGARQGLLIKGGAALETLGRLTDIAFDKTGTLTEGRPRVTDVIGFDRTRSQVLAMAAALESGSSHPIARAVLDRAEKERTLVLPAVEGKTLAGKGVEGRFGGRRLFLGSARAAAERAPLMAGQARAIAALNADGKTVSVLLEECVVVGVLAVRDEPRADARSGLAALRASGLTPVMLTCDNAITAKAIAADLGVEAHAELLPEDKLRIVRRLQSTGRRVGKVGDGINDAPALVAADVGIAMGGGTDAALEAAVAAAPHGRVMDVARMVQLSRAAMRNIQQNIAIALGLKAVFLVTTLAGVTGLWPAVLADTGATVLVTANAMRLLRWRPST